MLDFFSWRISYRELLARKDPNESMWDEIVGSKDPTVFTVFLEDSASLIGTFLAFLAIFLGHILHNPYLDPIASMLIALLLIAVALVLGRETGALLTGERTNRARIKRVREIISADPAVESVGDLLTMQLGPDQALLIAAIQFRRGLNIDQLESTIAQLKTRIHKHDPTITQVFIEPDSLQAPAARSLTNSVIRTRAG